MIGHVDTWKRTLNRVKTKKNPAGTKTPKGMGMGDIDFPDDILNFDDDKSKFVYYDSGKKTGKNRIVICTTESNIEKLIQCEKVMSDGTFRTPKKTGVKQVLISFLISSGGFCHLPPIFWSECCQ